jgi:glycosyltransferase involved in cell wall biosynthesis
LTLRLAILPPAPAAYREPLFTALHARDDLRLNVIYQSAAPASWDAAPGFSPTEHPYPAAHLRARQRPRPGRSPIVWPAGVEAALSAADPDCVIAVEYGAASLRALAWCRLHRRAYVVFSDCTPEINGMLPPGQLALHRSVARHADGMIAVSSAGRRRLQAFGVADERIALAPQGGDLAPVRAAVAATTPPAPPPLVVLSAGRLVPDKNLATLIEAVARADASGTRLALQIAGTGFLEGELRALAQARGVAATFLGAVAPAQMGALYGQAHAFALVSTFEPFGVVVREAVAAGLPVLCSRRAGAAGDVAIEHRNALLVDPERIDEIAAALSQLADDGPLRMAMAAQSRAIDAAGEGRDVEAIAAAAWAAAARRGRPS